MKAEITESDVAFAEDVMRLAKKYGVNHFDLNLNKVKASWEEPIHSFDED